MNYVARSVADPREHSAPPDDPVPITEADEQHAIAQWLAKTTAFDTLDDCYKTDTQHALDIAISRGDARLIGQILLATRYHLARRIALRELHGRELHWPTPSQVCAGVFLHANGAAQRRGIAS